MPRTFRAEKQDIDTLDSSEVRLMSQPVAVYYRQSTTAQVGNISTTIQTIDMVDELVRRGWKREDIYLIDDDEGVSGTKRIDEREGMSHLFELIAECKIGAVACQDEDRLFRDMTQIQVNIFIDTCRKSKVKVITPYMTYDFAHPLQGEFHARQFRFKCDMAAEYLKIYVLGRLVPARLRILREGKWGGSKIPVGYMVDVRKKLPNGTENPDYRKYVPFEPYAQIVREYFRVFIENGGNVRRAIQQIHRERISFPDCKAPDGFKIRYQLKWREHGYYLNRGCTVLLLTHPAYIGHWCVKGVVTQWDNHEPIVDADVFMRAFNYLSKFTLTGDENPNYQPSVQRAQPDLEAKRDVERPLLPGLIYSQVQGRWYRASINFDKKVHRYLYVVNRVEIDGTHMEWARRAGWIDEAVIIRFKRKLQATFDVKTWMQAIGETEKVLERERKLKQLQVDSLAAEKQNLVVSLGKLTDPIFIQDTEQRYKQVCQERDRLTTELANLEQQRRTYLTTEQVYALFEQTLNDWDTMTSNEQRNVLAMFIDRIEAWDYNRAGDMRLVVFWADGSRDEFQFWRKSTAAHWHIENTERLLALFDGGATQLELSAAFPDLKWCQIFNEIKRHRGLVRFSPSRLGKNETYHDYLASGGRKGKHTPSRWQPYEDAQLCQMVKDGVTQLEITKAYPFRRWIQIQYRIKLLLGKGIRVPMSGIGQHMSYDEYVQQTNTSDNDANSENPTRDS